MKERNAQGLTEQEFLSRYNPEKYEHPSVTVDTLIFTVDRGGDEDHLQILLTRRTDHPYMGRWAIPGGFVGMEESVEQAAVRKLVEETGIRDVYLEQLYTWGEVGRDPRTRIISVSYIVLIPREKLRHIQTVSEEKSSQSAADRVWYFVSIQDGRLRLWNGKRSLEEEELAFDHADMIRLALERMRNKVYYTDIAFKLLPDRFTFLELQRLYEVILGEKLHGPNFRRDMDKWVEKTEEKCKPQGAGKPARYYRKKR
ncbi:MAG: NUDIX hydrolase [bacterium]|nr:NUDIX hydrolase [bacterium]MCM1375661.1 NUDIX hydrolase [Muribaculum sp.]